MPKSITLAEETDYDSCALYVDGKFVDVGGSFPASLLIEIANGDSVRLQSKWVKVKHGDFPQLESDLQPAS